MKHSSEQIETVELYRGKSVKVLWRILRDGSADGQDENGDFWQGQWTKGRIINGRPLTVTA